MVFSNMNRMKLLLLILCLVFHHITCQKTNEYLVKCNNSPLYPKPCNSSIHSSPERSDAISCLEDVDSIFDSQNSDDIMEALENMEEFVEKMEVKNNTFLSVGRIMLFIRKPECSVGGFKMFATNSQISPHRIQGCKVAVHLPQEVEANNTIMLKFLTLPKTNKTTLGALSDLYDGRLVGVKVHKKRISGLQESVNITVAVSNNIHNQEPRCMFFNFSTNEFSSDGCRTHWQQNQSSITCSCDRLTYFGVLMVSSSSVPPEHIQVLTYLTLIGCSLSLIALVLAVSLFIMNRTDRADVSMKVHINLAVALILLNVSFLPSQVVAALSSAGFCIHMALFLHYSLLASFSWMALEGFHIYLLLIRVFNIYVKRYLLKLCVVGWGIPVIIVSLVTIIDRDAYGLVPLDSSNPNSTYICYITDDTVKVVTTVGVFGLVFIFNVIMFGVTIRQILTVPKSKESQRTSEQVKRDLCTVLGLITLLGITWGLVFFSFGYLTVPGLYIFCILNSLQGVFIFLWSAMLLRKNRKSALSTSSETQSTTS